MKPSPVRSLLVAGLALVLVSCGAAADARQDALDALERTTAASDLEAQMAGLVESSGLVVTSSQGAEMGQEIDRIDGEAEALLTASSSDMDFNQSIDAAVNETREAGAQLAVAVEKPAQLVTARKKASARLIESNKNLKTATVEIGEELAGSDGNLSEQDAEALGQTVTSVRESGQVVAEAAESAACSVPGRKGGAFAIEVVSGDLDCTEAMRIFARFTNDLDRHGVSPEYNSQLRGVGQPSPVDDWMCASSRVAYLELSEQGIVEVCTRESDSAEIHKRLPKIIEVGREATAATGCTLQGSHLSDGTYRVDIVNGEVDCETINEILSKEAFEEAERNLAAGSRGYSYRDWACSAVNDGYPGSKDAVIACFNQIDKTNFGLIPTSGDGTG